MDTVNKFDVVVIGAGPAGAEAAMAAGRAGANTLCLSINLDSVGFHPATPLLVENSQDVRTGMLKELAELGGVLPRLLEQDGIKAPPPATASRPGRIVINRRNLGLAYKEALESSGHVQLRQALVVNLMRALPASGRENAGDETVAARWQIATKLGEMFTTEAVVVATGTFLDGIVDEGGVMVPGGRLGEIPSRALAVALGDLGFGLTKIFSETPPRIDAASIRAPEPGGTVHDIGGAELIADGDQLNELMVGNIWLRGSRDSQLAAIRERGGTLDQAWMNRASWSVTHLALAEEQVDPTLEASAHPGIFFAGRAAGTCNFTEAAVTGLVAGLGAARAAGHQLPKLTNNTKYKEMICAAIAGQESRPVTIRIDGPGC